jgi:hypothetical protein
MVQYNCKLKLGDEIMKYGSLQNVMYADSKSSIKPEVGMGATLIMWTDRHAYTIIEVSKNGKTFRMQRDNAIRTDENGMSDSQSYRYERDTDGGILTVRLGKNGVWKVLKSKTTVGIGFRREYYDYSF